MKKVICAYYDDDRTLEEMDIIKEKSYNILEDGANLNFANWNGEYYEIDKVHYYPVSVTDDDLEYDLIGYVKVEY